MFKKILICFLFIISGIIKNYTFGIDTISITLNLNRNDYFDIENKTIFNLFIEQALGAENEVSRYIFKSYFIDKMKGVDIARKLHELGYYSSVQSASVMVSRKIDKMLKKFAELYSTIDKN